MARSAFVVSHVTLVRASIFGTCEAHLHGTGRAVLWCMTFANVTNCDKAIKILSKSVYRELRLNGYEPRQIVAMATEIIGMVTMDIRDAERGKIMEAFEPPASVVI